MINALVKAKIEITVLVTGLLCSLIVFPKFLDRYNLPKFLVLSIGSGIALAMLFMNRKLYSFTRFRSIYFFVSLFIFAQVISGLASNQHLYKTLMGQYQRNNGVLTYIFLMTIFISIALSNLDVLKYSVVKTLTFLGLILSVYGFFQRSEAALISKDAAAISVTLTMGNIDFAAALLGITGIATLVMFFSTSKNLLAKFCFIFLYYLHFNLLFDSPAKQGRVTLIIGTLFVIGFWLMASKNKIIKFASHIWWAAVLFGIIFSSLGVFDKGPLKKFFVGDRESLADRFSQWNTALHMINQNKIFGVGIDAFGDYSRRYQSLEAYNRIKLANAGAVDNPHNVFLHLGATGGLLLLICYLLLLIFIIYRSVISLRTEKESQLIVGGLFAIWISIQAQSIISIDQIGLSIWGWIVAGVLVNISYSNRILPTPNLNKPDSNFLKKSNSYKNKSVLALIVFQIPTLYIAPVVFNHFNLSAAVDKMRFTSTQEEISPNAIKLTEASLKVKEPILRMNVVRLLGDFGEIENAILLAKATTVEFPQEFEGWNTLAIAYEKTNRKDLAITPREKSIELDPLNQNLKQLLEEDKRALK